MNTMLADPFLSLKQIYNTSSITETQGNLCFVSVCDIVRFDFD